MSQRNSCEIAFMRPDSEPQRRLCCPGESQTKITTVKSPDPVRSGRSGPGRLVHKLWIHLKIQVNPKLRVPVQPKPGKTMTSSCRIRNLRLRTNGVGLTTQT